MNGGSATASARVERVGADTAWLGMVIFLGSWGMMFAALFFVVGALRLRAPAWPPAGMGPLPRGLPALNTVVLGATSLALELARRRVASAWRAWVAAALGLGTLFVALQACLWQGLWREGLRGGGGILPGAVYGLTGLHALHVAVGLVGLALLLRPRGGAARLPLRLWSLYWHFVGAVWLAMAALLFIA